ncbi:hypothetical protein M422DRAFT_89217, partial [Sphaerobolus stellatus SS14]
GKGATNIILTHCGHELFQAMIKLLFDPAFVYAWKHRILVECYDGITQHIYFWLITWSTDYPKKVLLTSIRDGGNCLCPTCLVQKSKVPLLGKISDTTTRMKHVQVSTQ